MNSKSAMSEKSLPFSPGSNVYSQDTASNFASKKDK